MTRDLKTGMALGLLLAVAAVFWLSARSDLSVDMGLSQKAELSYELPEEINHTDTNVPEISLNRTAREPENNEPPKEPQTAVIVKPEEQGPNVPDLTIYEQDEKIKTEKFHIIRPDETLSDISYQYYGTPNKWRKIVEANRDTIQDANRIKPGTKVIIPE